MGREAGRIGAPAAREAHLATPKGRLVPPVRSRSLGGTDLIGQPLGRPFPTLQFGTSSGVDLGSLTSRPTDGFLHESKARFLSISDCSDAFFGVVSCVRPRFLSRVSPPYLFVFRDSAGVDSACARCLATQRLLLFFFLFHYGHDGAYARCLAMQTRVVWNSATDLAQVAWRRVSLITRISRCA
ncbi:hypothetical protein NDU88_001669 [Pleurodeles waltl]|uniref:Uncharacterized protein n=1 Tax=Pleurodeles waltl TaxID=8319 RepID=A0AAV7R9R5_PLEWA|nr:hypothetical protein NDU88_001669 [Pleurodeles waltl]